MVRKSRRKMVRKCRRIADIAVMEVAPVGVRTRARTSLAMESASSAHTKAKRRRIKKGELLKFTSSSYVNVRSRKRFVIRPESKVMPVAKREERCSSPTSDQLQASCCSSNNSSELDEHKIKFVDLEVETSTSSCRRGREMTPSSELRTEISDVKNSTEKPADSHSRRRSTAEKMPTELELDDFFAAAEKDIQKQFTEKYNYDIVKDVAIRRTLRMG
ncbi:Cyclin-dependent kinase inhibitor [Quillaja saponaria]|uniref:Cyclin-dependent kinase inhibitor n=1 Tax=Quillaja saponaria TaxID=32244 RepID=A0AAD7PEP7_QUISA|nr:Cyclin-dependent kinase inhibitor [Quillaja saponaria]